ncbi:MAG: hypothetical protein EA381_09945 [Planctomycetaceae bacterium]|nr:MAG: hypothetical protein EA381_09945 [Planctomycetaceae bacterium]
MPIPDRPTFDSPDSRWRVRLTDDGSPTLVTAADGQAMHSGCGAVAETRHVYLRGGNVERRLEQGLPTRVLEVGFGSGLGWLLTADLAVATDTPLSYTALEIEPPPAAVIRQLDLGRYVDDRGLVDEFCDWLDRVRPIASGGGDKDEAELTFRFGPATLSLVIGDALRWCEQRTGESREVTDEPFDSIYFDPYSPEVAPSLWRTEVFRTLRGQLRQSGRLVTYCVSRAVRDGLSAAGFRATRVAGPPGGKREVLIAFNQPEE